jgi:ribonuclease R
VAAAPARTITGLLQVNPRGFGFVVPDQGGRDLFIPPSGVGDRRDGDRVEALVVREAPDGRLQGEIRRVVERTRRRLVGIYRAARTGPWGGGRGVAGVVEAYDRRFTGGIEIPEGQQGGAVNGLVVGVEITRGAQEERRAVGRVVEVLGPPDAPETDQRAVVRKFGLRDEFPPDTLAEAAAVSDQVGAADIRGREDFRGLPIVTIDGETAMDFDDAVLVRRHADATWELQVHIADVAHYVRPSTALDREAFERGTSVYFPGTSLPMLPHRLSNGICSLNPGVDRLVLSCLMSLDAHGQVTGHRLLEGVIRSAARMTYTNVAKILVDREPATCARYGEMVPHFRLMEELCGLLAARRRRRGSIDFDLPEPEVILAATGEITGIMALERNVAHRIIEEFMLAANEAVARHLFKARVPAIYRVHERPDPRRLEEFDVVARAFGDSLPRPLTGIQPAALQAMLDRVRGRPEEPFLAKLMLRSMKQARYSDRRDIHFGLASSCYTHFTSPIRRYPDLVVHRLVKRLLRGGPLAPRERTDLEGFLPDAAARSSFRERAADAAENELVERKKMTFMAARLGEVFDGFIGSVDPSGLFVELKGLFVEGLVPIAALPGDRYRFVERRRTIVGERGGRVFAIGDPVRVQLARVDSARLEIDFALVEARAGARPATARQVPGTVAAGPRDRQGARRRLRRGRGR